MPVAFSLVHQHVCWKCGITWRYRVTYKNECVYLMKIICFQNVLLFQAKIAGASFLNMNFDAFF